MATSAMVSLLLFHIEMGGDSVLYAFRRYKFQPKVKLTLLPPIDMPDTDKVLTFETEMEDAISTQSCKELKLKLCTSMATLVMVSLLTLVMEMGEDCAEITEAEPLADTLNDAPTISSVEAALSVSAVVT